MSYTIAHGGGVPGGGTFGVLEAASRATEDRGEPTLTTTCSAGGRILRGLVHHFRFRLLQFESLRTGVCGVFFCFFALEDAVIYSNSPYSTRGCIGRSRYCTLTFDALTLRLTFPGIFVGKGRSRSRTKDKSRDDPLHFTGDPLGTGYAKKTSLLPKKKPQTSRIEEPLPQHDTASRTQLKRIVPTAQDYIILQGRYQFSFCSLLQVVGFPPEHCCRHNPSVFPQRQLV